MLSLDKAPSRDSDVDGQVDVVIRFNITALTSRKEDRDNDRSICRISSQDSQAVGLGEVENE